MNCCIESAWYVTVSPDLDKTWYERPFWSHQMLRIVFFPKLFGHTFDVNNWLGSTHDFCISYYHNKRSNAKQYFFFMPRKQNFFRFSICLLFSWWSAHFLTFWIFLMSCGPSQKFRRQTTNLYAISYWVCVSSSSNNSCSSTSSICCSCPGYSLSYNRKTPHLNFLKLHTKPSCIWILSP